MTRLLIEEITLDSHRESFDLFVAGDLHYNHDGFTPQSFFNWRDAVVENVENGRKTHAILMGDYCTIYPTGDRRRLPKNQMADPLRLYTQMREWIRPIKDHTRLVLAGNHDEDWWKAENIDFVNWMCAELGLEYGSYDSYLRFKVKREAGKSHKHIDVFAWHGHGGGRTRGGALNASARPVEQFSEADIVLVGHTHRLGMIREQKLVPSERIMDFTVKNRFIVMTGGFQKGYIPERSTYISKRMLPPVAIGGVKLTVTPFKSVRHENHESDVTDVVLQQIY